MTADLLGVADEVAMTLFGLRRRKLTAKKCIPATITA